MEGLQLRIDYAIITALKDSTRKRATMDQIIVTTNAHPTMDMGWTVGGIIGTQGRQFRITQIVADFGKTSVDWSQVAPWCKPNERGYAVYGVEVQA